MYLSPYHNNYVTTNKAIRTLYISKSYKIMGLTCICRCCVL